MTSEKAIASSDGLLLFLRKVLSCNVDCNRLKNKSNFFQILYICLTLVEQNFFERDSYRK